MDMETTTIILLSISALCAATAATIRGYRWSYSRGYAHGKHCGFSEGLFQAHVRAAKQHKRSTQQKINR